MCKQKDEESSESSDGGLSSSALAAMEKERKKKFSRINKPFQSSSDEADGGGEKARERSSKSKNKKPNSHSSPQHPPSAPIGGSSSSKGMSDISCMLHALWYIRVSDAIPVLKYKGILSIFEYSRPLHPPLTPFIQYWGTLMRDRFPVLNTLPKLKYFPSKKPYNGNF